MMERAVLIAMLVASAGVASGSDALKIHGTLDWSYRQTDGNNFNGGTEAGSGGNYTAAVVGDLQLGAGFSLHAQGYAEQDGVSDEKTSAGDYVFLEYEISDALRIRGGLIKPPLGVYNEYTRAGIAYPYLDLPYVLYGNSANTYEGCMGGSISGVIALSDEWEMSYNVFAGDMKTPIDMSSATIATVMYPLVAPPGEETYDLQDSEFTEAYGAQLVFKSYSGIEFGVLAARGFIELTGLDYGANYMEALSGRFKFEWGNQQLVGEYLHATDDTVYLTDLGYLSYIYGFGNGHSVYAIYEHLYIDTIAADGALPAGWPLLYGGSRAPLNEHESFGIGAAFTLSPNVVLKAYYQWSNGNRYAYPDQFADIAADGLTKPTEFFGLGVSASF